MKEIDATNKSDSFTEAESEMPTNVIFFILTRSGGILSEQRIMIFKISCLRNVLERNCCKNVLS